MPIVSLNAVEKHYQLGETSVKALRGIDLDIEAAEFIAVAGPSGSGKTTLLNLIGCVDVATNGTVKIAGAATESLSDKELTKLRLNTLGFIFQSFNLIGVLTVAQNVELPLILQGKLGRPERQRRVDELLEAVGIGKYGKHRPAELSGGQRQRVAIARALVGSPRIVLADEPTANLDSATGYQIIDLMKSLNREAGTTFIFSTHDPKVIEHADRIVQLRDGKLIDA